METKIPAVTAAVKIDIPNFGVWCLTKVKIHSPVAMANRKGGENLLDRKENKL